MALTLTSCNPRTVYFIRTLVNISSKVYVHHNALNDSYGGLVKSLTIVSRLRTPIGSASRRH